MHHIFLNYFDLIGQNEETNDDLDLKKEDIDCLAEIIANVLIKEYYEEQK